MSDPWDKVISARHPDAKPAATDEKPAAETEKQIAARVHAEEVARAADITSACDIAGKPERAVGFISSRKSVGEVLSVLNAEMSNNGPQRKGEAAVADFHARRGRQI
jgi:hypothetical protein